MHQKKVLIGDPKNSGNKHAPASRLGQRRQDGGNSEKDVPETRKSHAHNQNVNGARPNSPRPPRRLQRGFETRAPSSRAEPVRILIAVTGSGALSAVGARDICSDVLPLPAAKRSDHPRRLNPSLWSSFPNEWCKTAALLLDSASAWRRSYQVVLLGIR